MEVVVRWLACYKTNVDYRHYYYIYYFTVSHKFELKTHHRYLPAVLVVAATNTASGPAISIQPPPSTTLLLRLLVMAPLLGIASDNV